MKVTLENISPSAEVKIVEIARVSSSREDKTEQPENLINYLIKNKHWSPFEHSFLTMKIVTSKAIGIQLLRHRSFTFQEFSQRYAKVSNLEPISFRLQAEKNRQSSTDEIGVIYPGTNKGVQNGDVLWDFSGDEVHEDHESIGDLMCDIAGHLEEGLRLYNLAIELGVAKECSRMILPMATETTIFMTGSIRSWIHLIDIRDDPHAQLEAQLIAKEMKRIMIENCPIISNARGWTL